VSGSELFTAPTDLTLVSDDDLSALETQGMSEFDRVHGLTDVTPENMQYATNIISGLDRIRAELAARQVRADRLAATAQENTTRALAELRARVHGPEGEAGTTESVAAVVDAEAIAAAASEGAVRGLVSIMGERQRGSAGNDIVKRAAASLAATAQLAERPKVQEARLSITASVDLPGVQAGGQLPTLEALADAMHRKARSLPVSRDGSGREELVASIANRFDHTIDDRTNPAEVEKLFRSLVSQDNQRALVAGGGWCAPSETRYDFFNIAGVDGLIDLPTFGVSRGGIRFPISPAIGDVFFQNVGSSPASGFGGFAFSFSNKTDPWLWTEDDDIATVTGSVNKPTLRVPCPTFDEERLECYGLTLTAGNLADDAYPEATANFLQLLMVAYQRAINARLISLMVANSDSPTTVAGGAVTDSAAPRLFNAVALAAMDYRARYAMRTDDVLEVVFPYWIREVIRADLAWKAGVELYSVSDQEINGYFTARNVRVQWVNDYQVRGSGQPGQATDLAAWPTTVSFMLYAAGTFLHGSGLSLDLGVVRDSILNAENDHTAAWAEECHLVAKVGHESRQYTVGFNVNGSTSALLTGTARV
jgi:hypothetical protein